MKMPELDTSAGNSQKSGRGEGGRGRGGKGGATTGIKVMHRHRFRYSVALQ